MVSEVLVNEEVKTLIRVMPNGDVQPTSFIWRDRTRYVGDIGRTWEERVDGKLVRFYLIQAVDHNTYELYWDLTANVWTVHRAWLRAAIA